MTDGIRHFQRTLNTKALQMQVHEGRFGVAMQDGTLRSNPNTAR